MQKIYLVGDCHSWRVWKEHLKRIISDSSYRSLHNEPDLWSHKVENNSDFNFLAWGKSGESAFNFNPKKYSHFKEASDLFNFHGPGGPENMKTCYSTLDQIKKDGTVIIWLGYIDIKNNLPKKQNAKEVVEFYVQNCIDHFGKENIVFAEPFPQFKETIVFPNEPRDLFLYDDRKKQNDLFIEYLNEEIIKHKLLSPITQKEILNSLNMEYLSIKDADLDKDFGFPLDGLKEDFYKNIFDLFLNKTKHIY